MNVSDAKQFGKVAVLMGGTAAERDVSLVSGQAVLDALLSQNVNAVAVDIGHQPIAQLQNQGFDRAFNVLHGRGGEDGQIQALLENLRIPYTGSAVMASSIGMDKYRTKLIWQGLGLPTPGFSLIRETADLDRVAEMGLPVMVKPAHEGSSIGISFVDQADELLTAWQTARQYDADVLAERWIEGGEYTVSILGDRALPMIKMETDNVFYDYEAKYVSDDTRYLLPCGLDTQLQKQLQQLALSAFKALGCKGWGRIDLMVDAQQQPWLIEVNTVPGMTSHSLVPMAANAVGINFEQLVWNILQQTMED